MGLTRYYSLSFFDFGDQLDTPLNVQKEIDRFVLIDKQIYGLYNIFGNGVVEGWNVEDNGYSYENGVSVSISPGSGIINYLAAQTSVSAVLTNLPTNSTVDIYVTYNGSTVRTRSVDFFYFDVDNENEFSIKIARIVVGNNVITSIDNTVRDLVGFLDIIQDEIDNHKHRGTPSKIDLQDETKNQLPGARIEGIDASKITSG
ncbi:MAG: hypothetical protein J7L15_03510, partial [Clostridiales bacterium]|nr:hypothetical protein [Clostridiales bacterium]